MFGENKFVLTLTDNEQFVISEFMNILDSCGIEMNDTDYMNVCRAIQNKETTVDEMEEQFSIEYFEL